MALVHKSVYQISSKRNLRRVSQLSASFSYMKNNNGFTLIELISVIIILGILARSAIGLFATTESVEANVVKNQLLSSLRVAQQVSLSRQNLTAPGSQPVSLNMNLVSGSWVFSVWDTDPSGAGNVAFDVSEIERSNTTLRFSDSDFSTACSGLSTSTSMEVEFDGDGNLLNRSQLRICVVGDQTIQVCVSSLGFAYEGTTCL